MIFSVKTLFILISIYSISAKIQTIVLDQPNNYILSAKDYDNSENIIVNIWGAGSGGAITKVFTYCNNDKNECQKPEFLFRGGSSGSFISANIITHGEPLNITIGKAGISCDLDKFFDDTTSCLGTDGGFSSVNNPNINLVAMGGISNCESYIMTNHKCQCSIYCNDSIAKPIIQFDETYGYIIDTANSNIGDAILNEFINGSIAPATSNLQFGNGAYCCPNKSLMWESSESKTYVGNGRVVIYFSTKYFQPVTDTSCQEQDSPSAFFSFTGNHTVSIVIIVLLCISVTCSIIFCTISCCCKILASCARP